MMKLKLATQNEALSFPFDYCEHLRILLIFPKSLQVDRLEDELVAEQEKFKAINEELEQTFAEMSGY